MFPKTLKLSLRQKSDFFQNSQRFFSTLFTFYFQKNQESSKILVIIPKKNIKKATGRNTAKRRIYNILIKKLKNLDKINLILVLRKNIEDISDKELEKELEKQLLKINK